ncbi:MAG: methionine--tRNA ligase [Deltaproteobacteria bacterium]|nr:methionine--tRNA ligase [Deltaproteobacteria bacterium]
MSNQPRRRLLVTPALPYANGSIHLGHLVEHIQVNTYVRARRMAGDQVLYVCGADSHGAAIEIAAKKQDKAPEVYVEEVRRAQEKSFERFSIKFDGDYGSTHTSENQKHANRFYEALKAAGHITTKEVEQLQDPTDGRFLADRFVKGTCPKCGAKDQYGDGCENCFATYRPTELIDPVSTVSGATPKLGKSSHYMVTLGAYSDRLKEYLGRPGVLHESLRNFLDTWFNDGLKDWDISRDGPYFGFKIPGEDNKYFYVWIDAPIGYVSLTERALDTGPMAHPIAGKGLGDRAAMAKTWDSTKNKWEDWWRADDVDVEHFIGKDILYFHTLFWPAMLMATGDNLPHAVHVHGMLTIDGVKMSKARGTFINGDDFAAVVEPQALRYYYAAKLTAEPQDIDLSFEDFCNRVNADLVNNLVNLVSRTVPLLHRLFGGKPTTLPDDHTHLVTETQEAAHRVEHLYRALDTAAAVRICTELGSKANKLLQDTAPWALVKTDPKAAQEVLTTALFVGKSCLALLKPVLPELAQKLEALLGVEPFTFENATDPLKPDTVLGTYEHLFARLDLETIKTLIKPTEAATTTTTKPVEKKAEKKPKTPAAPPAEIVFDDFAKVDLRAATILEATAVEGSDKLILVKADVGDLGVREIFTGLRPHVQPAQLAGKTVVVVCNLAPRKMAKFGISHGMVLAVGEPPLPLFVEGAKPGDRVS